MSDAEFREALHDILVDHEAAVWGATGPKAEVVRRRTAARIEALYAARSTAPTG